MKTWNVLVRIDNQSAQRVTVEGRNANEMRNMIKRLYGNSVTIMNYSPI